MSTVKAINSVVLASGGTDSTLAIEYALRDNPGGKVYMLSILYGQKHDKEIQAAKNLFTYYSETPQANGSQVVQHNIVDMGTPFAGSDSTLIDHTLAQPQFSYMDLLDSKGPSPTVVPFRNANLISLATSYAIINKLQLVYVGMHATDAHNWAYPDCTPEFLGAMANAVFVGSYQEVRLVTPFIWMEKLEVIEKGWALDLPFALTWSCYEGRDRACGTCPTCVERIEGFQQLGVQDPIAYEHAINWPIDGASEYRPHNITSIG